MELTREFKKKLEIKEFGKVSTMEENEKRE